MGVELLKLLLALGTGALGTLSAYIAGWVPPETTSSMEYAIMTVVLAVIKRGLDWLGSKANPTPTAPTSV